MSEQSCTLEADKLCLEKMWITAISWLSECITQHTACIQESVKPGSFLPERLIAVGEGDDLSGIRLCHKSELLPSSAYFTLSHCWGPQGIDFKLLQSSLALFFCEIPWNEIPKTFQQAIIATRILGKGFGVCYLWIDALCIIQDSREDWRQEAARMADIYENAVLNLAACVGGDSRAGLFPERDLFSLHTCQVQPSQQSSLKGPLKVRAWKDAGYSCVDSELQSRAWVLQELLLARRVLYFTPHHLVWECPSVCANEMEPNVPIKHHFGIKKRFVRYSPVLKDDFGNPLEPIYDHYRSWSTLVRRYTSCKLTKPFDKMIAIAGLARRMHASLGERVNYVAGLWDEFFFLQLLWDLQSGGPVSEYRAPSWSWASTDGTVYNHRTNDEGIALSQPLITTEIHIEHESNDPFGEIKAAELTITGPLLKCNLFNAPNRSEMPRANFLVDGKPLDSWPADLVSWPVQGQEAYLSFLCLENNDENIHILGLVLERVQNKQAHYRRLGRFVIKGETRECAMQLAKSHRLLEDEYERALVNGDYRFTVI